MKNFKRLLSILLVLAISCSLLAGCGSTTSTSTTSVSSNDSSTNDTESTQPENTVAETDNTPVKHKIGVMFASMSATELQEKEYLENYVGPAFNVEFMFSEILKDNGAAVTFIEQARSAGCEAIMNFYSDSIEISTATANEAGMYIINNNNYIPETVADMAYNVGSIGTSVAGTAEAYSELVKAVLSDGEEHNVVIVSGGAAQGNNQHRETTAAILQVLQDTYGLTYETDIETLSTSNVKTDVETGTSMKIAIYPGYAGTDTYVTGFSSLLQTGEYDIVLSTYGVYSKLVQPISEVESAFNMDIKLVSIAAIDEGAKTAFENGALDSALLSPGCMSVGAMFILLYNALEGNLAAVEKDAVPSQYQLIKWTCNGKDEYATVEKLDIEEGTYAITIDDINSYLVSKNSSVDYDAVNSFFVSLTAQTVAEKSGF